MGEPKLEDISDYNTLKGEKKRVVWAVIMAGLFMGVIYTIVYGIYDNKEDTLVKEESYKKVPMR